MHGRIDGKPIYRLVQEDPLLPIDVDALPPSLQYQLQKEPNEYIGADEKKKAVHQQRVGKMYARCEKRIRKEKELQDLALQRTPLNDLA